MLRMRTNIMRVVAGVVLSLWATGVLAATHTWTKNTTGSHDWSTSANWSSGVFVSDEANELRFDFGTMPNGTFITLTNVPAALSMNTLTLDGVGPNNAAGGDFVIGDNTSTWTIGDGTTATINLITTRGGGSDDRIIRWDVTPNLTLNQALTTFTGNGTFYERTFGFSGNIAAAGAGYGITKSGTSWMGLYGSNTYSGTTAVNGGILRLSSANALPGGTGVSGGISALTLNGGVLELATGNFERNLGTASNQFQITGGSSGFSSKGAHRYVRVNDDAAQELVWGSASFTPTVLVLNKSNSSDHSITFFNPLDLNGATRTVQVNAHTAYMPGAIRTSSGTAGITKTGVGTLLLTGAKTYNGDTTIGGGILSCGPDNDLGSTSGITFNGGTLRINGTSATNIASLGYGLTFTSHTGFDIADENNTFTVNQALNQGGGQFYKRGPGTLVLNEANTFTGYNYIYDGTLVLDYTTQDNSKLANSMLYFYGGEIVLRGGSHSETVASSDTYFTTYTSTYISRDGGTATIDLQDLNLGDGVVLGISEDDIATTTEALSYGVLYRGQVTVSNHFAETGGGGKIQAYSGYTVYTNGESGGDRTTVSEWQGGGSIGGTVDSYVMRIVNTGNSDVLSTSASGLRCENVASHLYAGGFDDKFTITGTGGLRTMNGNQRMILNVYTGVLTVDAPLTSGGSATLAKAGAGTLVVPYANTYSSATYVQDGILRLANDSAAGTTGGGIIVRSGAALEMTNSINIGAEALTLEGGGISGGGALRSLAGDNACGGVITLASDTRINSDSGTLTLSGDITGVSQTVTFGGAGNITVSNASVTAFGITKDGAGTLGIVVDDSSSTQWTCGNMALNDSTLQLMFNVTPSETDPVMKIVGDLTFSGTPTVEIVIDPGDITPGGVYPLVEVVGSAPSTTPTLIADSGALEWGGTGNNTLFWNSSNPAGAVFIFQ